MSFATGATPSTKKRPSENDDSPVSSAKRKRTESKTPKETTPASQRSRRSHTKGTWEYGVKKTLEDEFKEIAASNANLRTRKSKQSQHSPDDVTFDTPKEEVFDHADAAAETLETPETDSSAYGMQSLERRQPKVEDTESETYEMQRHPAAEEVEHSWHGAQHTTVGEAGHTTASKPHRPDTSETQSSRVRRDTAHDEEDSSDEAPETITNASAIAKAKQVVAHAAKAAERSKADKKHKRRQLDARLKSQALLSQQRKKPSKPSSASAEAAPPPAPAASSASSTAIPSTTLLPQSPEATADATTVPALLPASLLARAGDVRPPTPDRNPALSILDPKQQRRNQHIRFIEQGERPAKDVQKGPVRVRVLEARNELLAPKAARDAKVLREYMLQGRNGDGSFRKYARMERKKIGGGFLKS